MSKTLINFYYTVKLGTPSSKTWAVYFVSINNIENELFPIQIIVQTHKTIDKIKGIVHYMDPHLIGVDSFGYMPKARHLLMSLDRILRLKGVQFNEIIGLRYITPKFQRSPTVF